VAGYDGIEEGEHALAPLTTLKQPVYDIARRLVQMLLQEIEGRTLVEKKVLLQPELVVRASTGG
jgi:LacI family transcriptional regulator